MPDPRAQRRIDGPRGLGWLCPTEEHRSRMLDMGPRVVRARSIAAAAVGLGLLATIGETGWRALVLFAIALVNLATLERRIERAVRPELVVAGSLLLILGLMGANAAMTGGGVSPVLPWLAIPVAVATMRFREVVVWALAGVAAVTALAVGVAGGLQHTVDHPLVLVATLVLLIAVTAACTALMSAELQFRSESVLDPLTGLLNRAGLEARFAELGEQARILGRPMCLIMCDLDHFKRINDVYGHERGDAVLREATYEMRKALRSFELFYRLGGEEFLVVLPGVELPKGIEIAHGLRAALQAGSPGGLGITASFGVSVARGEGIDFLPLCRAADEALYRAKAGGRDSVVGFETTPAGAGDAAAPVEHLPAAAHELLVGARA